MSRPVRLAVLLQDLEFGGTQRYALTLVRGLDRALFAPELWVLNSGEDLAEEAGRLGAPLVRVSRRPPGSPLALPPLALTIARRRPEILYTLTVVPNIWGRLFGRALGVPVLAAGFRELVPRQWERLLWRVTDRLICNAEPLRQRAMTRHGVPADRVATVPNCVDVERFRPREGGLPEAPQLVSVARLVRDKSPLVLAEALVLVRKRVPDARLTLVGDGPLRGSFEARLRELGLADAVRVVTGCGEVRPHLAEARVFVLASRREGAPNAVLEAMASGLPVAACRTGGLPDLVEHGRTGLLAEPENPASLAENILRLLGDPDLCARLGRAARDRAERDFSPGAMVRATQAVLLDAWAGRTR